MGQLLKMILLAWHDLAADWQQMHDMHLSSARPTWDGFCVTN